MAKLLHRMGGAMSWATSEVRACPSLGECPSASSSTEDEVQPAVRGGGPGPREKWWAISGGFRGSSRGSFKGSFKGMETLVDRPASPAPTPRDAFLSRSASSTSMEQGGLTISEQRRGMLDDADIQEDCAIPVVCELLERTVAINDKKLGLRRSDTTAHASNNTPAADYVGRILAKEACSPCSIVVGIMYLERLKANMPCLRLTSNNFEEILCATFNLGSKFCDDKGISNAEWAAHFGGGMSLQELNALELELLSVLDFELGVTSREYKRFLRLLMDDAREPDSHTSPATTPSGPRALNERDDLIVPKGSKLMSPLDSSGTPVVVSLDNYQRLRHLAAMTALPEVACSRRPSLECPGLPAKDSDRRAARQVWGAHAHE